MIDDHMTADGKIGNRLTFILKYPKNESLKEDLNKESLEQEIRKAIREHFKTWDDEDYEDMIGEYLVVEVEDQEDGRTKVEVRAELTYNTMDKIADELNKIVQKYDKDAYFDHEDAGIINAFIDKNAEGKSVDEYDASKDEKLQGVRLRDYRNKWSAIDHMEVNGVDYYMFENDTYGDETYYVVTPNINDGPFYETFDDIETCLRDEGILEESLKEEKKLDEIFVDTYLTKEHLSYVLHNVLDWEREYSPENKSDIWEVAHACHIYDDDYSDSEYAEAIELYDAFDEDGNVTSRIDEKLIQGKSEDIVRKNTKTNKFIDKIKSAMNSEGYKFLDVDGNLGKFTSTAEENSYYVGEAVEGHRPYDLWIASRYRQDDTIISLLKSVGASNIIQYKRNFNNVQKGLHYVEFAFEAGRHAYDDLEEKLIQGKSDATLKKNIATEVKAGKDPKQAYAIAKSVQKKNESFEDEHLGEVVKDDEIVDYFDNSVHDEDIIEDDFDEKHIEELAKKAIEESKKHTKEVGNTINENKTEVTPTQEVINESINSNEEVAIDYVSPNAVDANFQAQEVDLNNI